MRLCAVDVNASEDTPIRRNPSQHDQIERPKGDPKQPPVRSSVPQPQRACEGRANPHNKKTAQGGLCHAAGAAIRDPRQGHMTPVGRASCFQDLAARRRLLKLPNPQRKIATLSQVSLCFGEAHETALAARFQVGLVVGPSELQ
jgi:hypothetical protein